MTEIVFARSPAAALLYHVLAHLNLGQDAANLHDPNLPEQPWVPALLKAYRDADGRLAIHAAGLATNFFENPPSILRDEAGAELCRLVSDAMRAEAAGYSPPFSAVPDGVAEGLAALRGALYEQTGAAPRLTVWDCPALRLAGRATALQDERVVAVSLGQEPGHVLCQIIHEEIHAVTDPVVRAGFKGAARQDTRVDSPGFALHAELERAAIEVGDALIAARAPQWSDAYSKWRARFARS